MLGKAMLMSPDGVAREYAVYADNRDLATDHVNGVIHDGDEIVYRNIISEVVGLYIDEDGFRYTELLALNGLNGFTFIINQGGPAA